jgi:GntR family transcriptional regulator
MHAMSARAKPDGGAAPHEGEKSGRMEGRRRQAGFGQDADDRVPRYLRVASVLRRRIRDGHWAVGDRMATLEELEREFGVARVTVRQAVELLQREGLVKSLQGRGTFVMRAPESDRWLRLATDWETLIAPIRDNVPEILHCAPAPPPRIEAGDGVAASGYVHIRSVQKRAGRPYAYARVHLAEHVHRRATRLFARRVALAVLAEMAGLEISRAHQTLAIGAADLETARHLGMALNAPTAEARCVVTDAAGLVIYVGEITYPGECVRLNIELIGEGRR